MSLIMTATEKVCKARNLNLSLFHLKNLSYLFELIGVGYGGQGGTFPPKIWEKYFSGNYYVKFVHFLGVVFTTLAQLPGTLFRHT